MTSKICVAIPAYNSSRTIKNVVTGALRYVSKVIVADDGSTDNTAEIAAKAGADVIFIEKNSGKGNALKEIFRKGAKEGYHAVITMDADGQHDTDEIPSFIDAHNKCADGIILGSRFHQKENIPGERYNAGYVADFFVSRAANQRIEDSQCGFRLYPLSLTKRLVLTTENFATETELLVKAGDMGFTITGIKTKALPSIHGSHLKPMHDVVAIASYLFFYLTIRLLKESASTRSFTYSPGNTMDKISRNNLMKITCQTIIIFTTAPLITLFLVEYFTLSSVINNFVSFRKSNVGFPRFVLAVYMLPVILLVVIVEKMLNIFGLKLKITNSFVERMYSTE
ncbi:MAG: glycosyltransferase family 2 protein [Planctomycetes bacterium]|nr:glycosyltransferase family 2 protein [Planctomycetota bacterium]